MDSNIKRFIVFLIITILLAFAAIEVQLSAQALNRGSTPLPGEQGKGGSQRYVCRVNVGGSILVDIQGNEWQADHIYRNGGFGYLGVGGTYETPNAISGTDNQKIYKTERYQLFGYRFDVPNGDYEIILHFAEIYHQKKGQRLMDIFIEDKLVEQNLDIVGRVGPLAALRLAYSTKELGIPIRDNRIDIKLKNIKDDTKLSGIEVIQLPEQPELLQVQPATLDFGTTLQALSLEVKNIGTTATNWVIDQNSLPNWIRVQSPKSGDLAPGGTEKVMVTIERSALKGGMARGEISVIAGESSLKVPVSAIVAGAAAAEIQTKLMNFENGLRQLPLIFSNQGGKALDWVIDKSSLPAWVERVYPEQGRLDLEQTATLNVTVNRATLSEGQHQASLTIKYPGGAEQVQLTIAVPRRHPRVLFVDASARGMANGKSWQNAFRTIKTAIHTAGSIGSNESVEIWVAQGMYYEYDILVTSGIELYGGFKGDETVREERIQIRSFPTIVDAGKRGRCFECLHRNVIDGFVIQNGRDWKAGEGKGAGILSYENDVKIRNNIIRYNIDSWAGALFVEGDDLSRRVAGHSPLIEFNVLTENFSNYCAAAIEVRGSAATIRNNTIVNNNGYGLEINTVLTNFKQYIFGDYYNNIISDNYRFQSKNDVWAEARKATNYCFVGKQWDLRGDFPPYSHGAGNIFGDVTGKIPGFVDPEKGDYRLLENSACIDAGHPSRGADADGSPADLGAFPFNKVRTDLQIEPMNVNFGSKSRIETVTISASGGKTVHWRAAVFSSVGDCFSVEPGEGTMKNGQKTNVHISVNRDQLADGRYTGYFSIMTDDRSYEAELAFLVNNQSPEIELQKTSIVINAELQGPNPKNEQVMVINTGQGDLIWQAEKVGPSDWLHLDNANGASRDEMIIRFSPSHLGYGDYSEHILVYPRQLPQFSVRIPVTLHMKPGKFFQEIEAEYSIAPAKTGWTVANNDGAVCMQSIVASLDSPNPMTRLDYEFTAPDGVEYVYVFAEIDVNQSRESDSFWFMVNDFDPCLWDHVNYQTDGWTRAWVYQKYRDDKHMFVVNPGKNRLNMFTRETGGFINWMVITNDPDVDIRSYRFGRGSTNPPAK
ncbi:MAG: malectin domain-containing carbohydrate-binding protein [Candidatus Zhuqueibacterota bacterium]